MTNLRNFPTTATFLGEQSEQIVWEFSRDKAKKYSERYIEAERRCVLA